jgi:hypothetical protein
VLKFSKIRNVHTLAINGVCVPPIHAVQLAEPPLHDFVHNGVEMVDIAEKSRIARIVQATEKQLRLEARRKKQAARHLALTQKKADALAEEQRLTRELLRSREVASAEEKRLKKIAKRGKRTRQKRELMRVEATDVMRIRELERREADIRQKELGLLSIIVSPNAPSATVATPKTPASNSSWKSGSTNPNSPSYNPTSPSYSPNSPGYTPTTPSYGPDSPNYEANHHTHGPTGESGQSAVADQNQE